MTAPGPRRPPAPGRADDGAPGRGEVLTVRGARSRAALVRAAREIFERDGLVDVSPASIALAAGVSRATFYTYFADLEEILHAVVRDSLEPAGVTLHPPPDPVRARLIDEARSVFLRTGFADARAEDIARRAGLPLRTFHDHFADTSEAFTAVLDATREEMLHPRNDHRPPGVREQIASRHRAYLDSYARNARLMVLLEQAALVYPAFRELRLRRAEAFVERNAQWIARLQGDGVADPDLDPTLTSRALSAMVSRLAHFHFGLRSATTGVDDLVKISTEVWVRTLRISPDEPNNRPEKKDDS
ncbi:TetR/AcrR family transcriptional regulator [Tsukamurella sp. 1534]|uniref:TetR/AcrR family transcriptional regulator n=1 Tax=Tsukamurella sp. 1534 TaxID=1151061 RepID=UPI0002F50223|nr:TetR/AcrR family transcriptional regulator [Tsukamurella sp. 1534]